MNINIQPPSFRSTALAQRIYAVLVNIPFAKICDVLIKEFPPCDHTEATITVQWSEHVDLVDMKYFSAMLGRAGIYIFLWSGDGFLTGDRVSFVVQFPNNEPLKGTEPDTTPTPTHEPPAWSPCPPYSSQLKKVKKMLKPHTRQKKFSHECMVFLYTIKAVAKGEKRKLADVVENIWEYAKQRDIPFSDDVKNELGLWLKFVKPSTALTVLGHITLNPKGGK